jgi:hypothetical protein
MNLMPVLLKHDQNKPLGTMTWQDGKLLVTFKEDANVTREKFFDIFGGVGARVTEFTKQDKQNVISKAEILEFSYNPSFPSKPLVGFGWLSMEDAPQDKRILLKYEDGNVSIGRWNADEHAKLTPRPYWSNERFPCITEARKNQPISWQPLPE